MLSCFRHERRLRGDSFLPELFAVTIGLLYCLNLQFLPFNLTPLEAVCGSPWPARLYASETAIVADESVVLVIEFWSPIMKSWWIHNVPLIIFLFSACNLLFIFCCIPFSCKRHGFGGFFLFSEVPRIALLVNIFQRCVRALRGCVRYFKAVQKLEHHLVQPRGPNNGITSRVELICILMYRKVIIPVEKLNSGL